MDRVSLEYHSLRNNSFHCQSGDKQQKDLLHGLEANKMDHRFEDRKVYQVQILTLHLADIYSFFVLFCPWSAMVHWPVAL